MKWTQPANPWHSEHVEIDTHLAWRMARDGKATDDANTWMFALLELAVGIGVTAFEKELEKREFAGWKAHIRITKSWRGVLKATGAPLDKGGFVTALITPAFIAAVVAAGQQAATLLRSLGVARDAEQVRVTNIEWTDGTRALKFAAPMVVMGIIDDALPLAHPRFRHQEEDDIRTRWHAAWLQADPVPPCFVPDTLGENVNVGPQWSSRAIDRVVRLARGNQIEAMRLLGQIGGDGEDGSRLHRRAAHGFHVADLMAGYGDDDSTGAARPVIGVQLPPTASRDAIGLSLAPYVVDALIYIIGEAGLVMRKASARAPIVVNLSYGVFTGAHDGSSQLERALSHIVDTYNKANADAPLILTVPAGNTLQARGHACLTFGADGMSPPLAWRILPDSGATALLEIWWPAGDGGSVTLTPPSGPEVTILQKQRFARLVDDSNSIIGQAEFIAPCAATGQTRPMVAIAIAPTAPIPDAANSAVAPHGRWRISVTGKPGDSAHLWIARGDTPYGFSKRGRQSYFEDPGYEVTDRFGRPAMEDTPGALIKRGGSMSGLATARSPDIVVVGAWDDRAQEASRYSGAGYPLGGATPGDGVTGPDVMATADQGRSLAGVLAAGVVGGSYVALNGTSVAAPQVARAVADRLATALANTGKKMSEQIVASAGKPTNASTGAMSGNGWAGSMAEPMLAGLGTKRRG